MAKKRTDVHRPTEINPDDYQYVCVMYLWTHDLGDAIFNTRQREIFWKHMEKTGGKFADIDHGGTCFCCGANARFVARFYHEKSNSYVDLGEICADRLEMGDVDSFRTLRKVIGDARKRQAGKAKATKLLEDWGMERVWDYEGYIKELYARPDYNYRMEKFEEKTLEDLLARLVKYGKWSDKQLAFARKLLEQIDKREIVRAKRIDAKKHLPDVPEGRIQLSGTILKMKQESDRWRGEYFKIYLRDDRGFTVWGSLPTMENSDRLDVGDIISFTARVKRAEDDTKHGFYSNPTKGKIVSCKSLIQPPHVVREENKGEVQ